MVDPFGAVSFMTRSENRVEVLAALSEETMTERDLVESTGVSDVTVSRSLEDFLDRGWVVEADTGYELSAVGEVLAADYRRLERSMDVACRLGPVRDLLPLAEMDFDLRLLADARVTDPEQFDAMRTVDRWLELIRGADHIRVVALAANANVVVSETVIQEVADNGMRFEAVLAHDYFDPPEGRPDIRDLHREMLEAGADLYQLPPETAVEASVALYDDLAAVAGFSEDGTLRAGIESRADPVRTWVRDEFRRHRETAVSLSPEDI